MNPRLTEGTCLRKRRRREDFGCAQGIRIQADRRDEDVEARKAESEGQFSSKAQAAAPNSERFKITLKLTEAHSRVSQAKVV